MTTMHRRAFVTWAGAAVLGPGLLEALLACGSSNGASTPARPHGELEIFSWWTAGGELDGLEELYSVFHRLYPEVTIKNSAVAGSAGTIAKPVLIARLQNGQPPDSFQVHAGKELIDSWVTAGKMQSITDIWMAQGWDQVIPAGLKEIVSANGEAWSVPVNVHRGNALWYSPKALATAGVSPPTSLEDFFAGLATLQAKGMAAPLALGSRGNWQVAMLFENNVLARGGASYYKQLFAGKASFGDQVVKQALEDVKHALGYANADHPTLDWDQACRLLSVGTAAYTIMGDWAKGYFTANGWSVGTDFDVVPSPGTAGSYVVVCDTFGLPRGARNLPAARAWIEVCGSRDGQAAFNPKKGSIPARTDIPKELFDPISQRFIGEFKTDTLVPSSAHGSATPQEFASGFNDEMGRFVLSRDVEATSASLQALAAKHL